MTLCLFVCVSFVFDLNMISYDSLLSSVISVTHSLGFESKLGSYATLRSHTLCCLRRRVSSQILKLLSKFHSRSCA